MTKLTPAQRQRQRKEQRCVGIARHLGTTVEAESAARYGAALPVTALNPMQLHALTEALWERQHRRDQAAADALNALTPAEQQATYEQLLGL